MDAQSTAWIFAALAFCLGTWVGMKAANRKWADRGDNGYPRVEYAGRLYWVNRDSDPCFRCCDATHAIDKLERLLREGGAVHVFGSGAVGISMPRAYGKCVASEVIARGETLAEAIAAARSALRRTGA